MFVRSIAIILINICEYGVPHCGAWLSRTMQICFWIYVGLSTVASAGLYLILWSTLYVQNLPSKPNQTKSRLTCKEYFPST